MCAYTRKCRSKYYRCIREDKTGQFILQDKLNFVCVCVLRFWYCWKVNLCRTFDATYWLDRVHIFYFIVLFCLESSNEFNTHCIKILIFYMFVYMLIFRASCIFDFLETGWELLWISELFFLGSCFLPGPVSGCIESISARHCGN